MNKIKVLIADEHALFREGTRSFIENENDMEVIGEARDGAETIKLVYDLRPHVVLMDVAMPKVDGAEAARRIKAECPATAILILTDYDSDRDIIALLEAGAAGYLLKNLSGADLVNAIRAVHAGEAVLHPAIAQKIFSRMGSNSRQDTAHGTELSEREREILKLAARGLSNQDIAAHLYLSHRTVQAHLANIFRKMDAGSRTEAVLKAITKGWLGLDDLL
jgi:NarL family two-component system response regulator LiaR